MSLCRCKFEVLNVMLTFCGSVGLFLSYNLRTKIEELLFIFVSGYSLVSVPFSVLRFCSSAMLSHVLCYCEWFWLMMLIGLVWSSWFYCILWSNILLTWSLCFRKASLTSSAKRTSFFFLTFSTFSMKSTLVLELSSYSLSVSVLSYQLSSCSILSISIKFAGFDYLINSMVLIEDRDWPTLADGAAFFIFIIPVSETLDDVYSVIFDKLLLFSNDGFCFWWFIWSKYRFE